MKPHKKKQKNKMRRETTSLIRNLHSEFHVITHQK